jgi:hypothetical protein
MQLAVLSVMTFAAAFVGAGWAVTAASVFRRALSAEAAANLAFAAYLLAVTGFLCALGYALVTAPFRAWRRQPLRRAVLVSAGLGVAAFGLHVTGLSYHVLAVAAPLRRVPGVGVYVLFMFPGLVTGLAGLLLAHAWPAPPPPGAGDP